jgi:pimeloyl-ACP methyl ester carboxylesterase
MSRVPVLLRRLGRAGGDFAAAMQRTSRFAVQLSTGPRPRPPHLRRASLVAAAAADELLLACFQQVHEPDADTVSPAVLDESHALIRYLEGQGAFAKPDSWHLSSAPAVLNESARRIAHVSFSHVTYASPYRPTDAIPGARRYAEHTLNEVVHAWLLRQERPAPWIVCVHGAGMGEPFADIAVFRARSLHAAGFNVAIPVLPHHGPRGTGRFTVAFPSGDPTENVHGATQAIADVRALLAYIATRDERAVLFGLSLGGYVAAAVAALEPALAGVVVGVPVVDIPEIIRTNLPARYAERYEDVRELAERLDAVTSPLALPSPAAPVRRIWAGCADRLVRPGQVERLADHWSMPAVSWYQGGHLGFFGAPTARRCVSNALIEAGVASRKSGRLVAI